MISRPIPREASSRNAAPLEGLVLRTESGFCRVLTDAQGIVVVNLAKKIRSGQRTSTTSLVIGDRVRVRLEPGETGGVVEAVMERRNELVRLAPGRKSLKDVLAANLDRLVIVQALHRPDFNTATLDRFLAIAEQAEIPATVVLNKADLADQNEALSVASVYRAAGYPVIISSAKTCQGIDDIHRGLQGLTALVGPSGVGKSTILNRIRPGLRLQTAEISEATGKGRHTTVRSELLHLDGENYVADTPGLRSISLIDIDRYEVAWLFREFQPFVGRCRFPDCLHEREPGCRVLDALGARSIAASRYQSYQRLLDDVRNGTVNDWE